MGRLDGKVAIITGAGRGTGAVHARRFVEEGARVLIGDVVEERVREVAEPLGAAAHGMRFDAGNPAHWAEAVDVALERFGKIDVLVNHAGVNLWKSLVNVTVDEYMQIFATNQLGVFLGMRAVSPVMMRARAGSIINIGSAEAFKSLPGILPYTATKWAIRGMTRTAALELGPYGIRVNTVCPGAVNSVDRLTEFGMDPKSENYKGVLAMMPLRRLTEPHEVSSVVIFLASDESSGCTAEDFIVNAGETAIVGPDPARHFPELAARYLRPPTDPPVSHTDTAGVRP
ncbi:MAG: SDR family NAD(P)-dependent oxidoreductase [Gammaproteobacteria bacterium]